MVAAKRFFDKAMGANGEPGKIAMDKSGANKAAIDAINAGRDVPVAMGRSWCARLSISTTSSSRTTAPSSE
jgi:transposase-like protein